MIWCWFDVANSNGFLPPTMNVVGGKHVESVMQDVPAGVWLKGFFAFLPLLLLFLILHLSEKLQLPLTYRNSSLVSGGDHALWNASACTCAHYSFAQASQVYLLKCSSFFHQLDNFGFNFSRRARGSAEGEWGGRWRTGLSRASAGVVMKSKNGHINTTDCDSLITISQFFPEFPTFGMFRNVPIFSLIKESALGEGESYWGINVHKWISFCYWRNLPSWRFCWLLSHFI